MKKGGVIDPAFPIRDRKSTRLNSSHVRTSYAAFCLKKKTSDDASYVTGQTIYACGGITLYADFKQNWAS